MNNAQAIGLTKRFGDFTLDRVSFTVPEGCVVGFIGENGAGKSTTIKCLLGLVNPDGGKAEVFGKPAETLSKEEKNRIGAVLGENCLPENLTLKEVSAVMKNVFGNWNEGCFFEYARKFALPEEKKMREFSRGMQQKAAIAVALSHEARLLVLDEPTSGLDPVARDEILDILYDFMQDESRSVLISSHIVSDLEKLCDYIVFIHGGKVAVSGEKDALLEEYAVYGGNISDLDPAAVVRVRRRNYGADALVKRSMIPPSFGTEKTTLEDIMLFFVKGEKL